MIKRLLNHPVSRNALLMYSVQLSTYFLPLLTLPYLSRVLSPQKYGLIAFSQSFMWYFVSLTEYGFNLTATRRVAIDAHDPEKVSRIFCSVMLAKLLLTAIGFVVMAAVVLGTPRLRPDWDLFGIGFLGVIGNLLFPVWLFQGLQKMQHIAARDFIAKLTAVAALFLFVHSDRDYLLAAGVQSGGQVFAGFVGLLTVPYVTSIRLRFPTWSEVVESLKNGWSVFLSMAAMTLSGSTNTFIMGFFAPLSEVAYFSNAQRVIVAMRMLVSPVATALYPHMGQKAAYSKAEGVRFLRKYSFLISAPFLLLSLCVLVTAPMAVRIVFGPQYAPTALPLQIMAFSPFLLALSHCYSTNFMLAFGYEKQWSRIIFGSVIGNFALLIPLLYLLRPSVGVAVTWIVLDVITTLLYYMFYRRHSVQYLDGLATGIETSATKTG